MEAFHLFDAELRYTDDTTAVVRPDCREGAYLALRAGFSQPVDELCRTHPGGEMHTEDGAVIRWPAA